MAAIRWTREAEVWLKEIFDYIAQDNPAAATRQVSEILAKVQTLGFFPRLGQRYEAIPDREVRIFVHPPYKIAYLIKDSGDIDILGVFHGALDIQRYLF